MARHANKICRQQDLPVTPPCLGEVFLAGDIKKLKGFKKKYRLRAGNYRVLFESEGACLVVYNVGDRKDIYE
jgi:mRNA-degrading endonuclease RelE of RelBE toxin-antitoxin system